MNRFVHLLNAGLWVINGITWAGYTHRPGMALVSCVAALIAGFMWWSEPA